MVEFINLEPLKKLVGDKLLRTKVDLGGIDLETLISMDNNRDDQVSRDEYIDNQKILSPDLSDDVINASFSHDLWQSRIIGRELEERAHYLNRRNTRNMTSREVCSKCMNVFLDGENPFVSLNYPQSVFFCRGNKFVESAKNLYASADENNVIAGVKSLEYLLPIAANDRRSFIEEILKKTNPFVRSAILDWRDGLSDDERLYVTSKLLKDGSPIVREKAAESISRVPLNNQPSMVIEALDDADEEVRLAASRQVYASTSSDEEIKRMVAKILANSSNWAAMATVFRLRGSNYYEDIPNRDRIINARRQLFRENPDILRYCLKQTSYIILHSVDTADNVLKHLSILIDDIEYLGVIDPQADEQIKLIFSNALEKTKWSEQESQHNKIKEYYEHYKEVYSVIIGNPSGNCGTSL